ncbi:hypothetical protein Tdes44962_MAKER10193, partial [Teratosphaeria destructans]
MQQLDLLILGAGWTSTFLLPLTTHHHLTHAATTRDGRPVAHTPTLAWTFDPTDPSPTQFAALPLAKNILITFPLTTPHQTHLLVSGYRAAHPGKHDPRFIQLGSTGIWQIPQPPASRPWVTRRSPHDAS